MTIDFLKSMLWVIMSVTFMVNKILKGTKFQTKSNGKPMINIVESLENILKE